MPEEIHVTTLQQGIDAMREHARLQAQAVTCLMFCLIAAAGPAAAADPRRGEQLYLARCGACHSIDANGAGPRHRGLLGRKAGSLADYDYSTALRQSGIVWTLELLSRWIANPNALVPGNKMVVQLANDPLDRADIVEYLRLSSPPGE